MSSMSSPSTRKVSLLLPVPRVRPEGGGRGAPPVRPPVRSCPTAQLSRARTSRFRPWPVRPGAWPQLRSSNRDRVRGGVGCTLHILTQPSSRTSHAMEMICTIFRPHTTSPSHPHQQPLHLRVQLPASWAVNSWQQISSGQDETTTEQQRSEAARQQRSKAAKQQEGAAASDQRASSRTRGPPT